MPGGFPPPGLDGGTISPGSMAGGPLSAGTAGTGTSEAGFAAGTDSGPMGGGVTFPIRRSTMS